MTAVDAITCPTASIARFPGPQWGHPEAGNPFPVVMRPRYMDPLYSTEGSWQKMKTESKDCMHGMCERVVDNWGERK